MNHISKYKVPFTVLLAFILITFLYFPKLFTGFSSYVETNDGRLVAWIISWDIHKILTDPFNIYQANTFYPNPNTLSYSENLIGSSLLGIPVWLPSGGNPAATFNFIMIFGYVSNAFFTFLLIRKLVNNNGIAFIGAFINGFCSYRLWNIGHLQNIIVFYIPLCLLLFYIYLDTKKIKYLVGIGICLLLQSLSSWYHMIFIFLMLSIVVLFYYLKKRLSNQDLIKLGVTFLVVFILFTPFAIPYLKQNRENNTAYLLTDIISGDFGGYLMPPPYTFLNGINTNYFGVTKSRWLENFNFVGYTALFLSIYCLYKLFRIEKANLQFRNEATLFAIIAAVFFIFSLGPFLIINDHQTSIKLPYYYIFQLFSPIRFLRVTARYSTVIFLMLSLLASFGLFALLKNSYNRLHPILIILLFIVAAVEYTPIEKFDRFTDMSNVPQVYRHIKKDSSIKAFIELPINVDPFTTTKYIYYAGIHFKPIVNGYSGYEPPSYTLYKNAFDEPLNQFTSTLLSSIGVTHILCNPEYNQRLNSTLVDLVLTKDGYRLYKIKNSHKINYYMESIAEGQWNYQTNDSSLRIHRKEGEISLNPANPHTIVANISPKFTNNASTLIYDASKPLDSLLIKFRAYSATDTLKIECFKRTSSNSDSLVKSYIYSNNSAFLNQFAVLDLYKSDKIKITLFATEFTDRTFIRDLIFIDNQ